MRWVRGGTWLAEASFADLPVTFSPVGRVPRAERPYDHRIEDDMWWAAIGEPLGFEPYEVDETLAERMLVELEALPEQLAFGKDAWNAREAVCAWLTKWGPPVAVVGATPLSMVKDFRSAPRSFDSLELSIEFEELMRGKRMLDTLVARQTTVDQVAPHLFATAHRALQDSEVFPVIRPEGVSYDARPRSLRAYLWQWLLWRCGRVPRQLCRYCAEPFDAPLGPGQPPAYCPSHRDSKYRHRVRKNLAPSMRIPAELNEED